MIKKCQNGDSAAFADLIFPHRENLITYLNRLSGNKTTAEDLFQETLVKVWSGIKKYKEQNKFSSWLFSIAHNVALDSYRKIKNRKYTVDVNEITDLSSGSNPHSDYVSKEIELQLEKAIETLSKKQKEVFLLRMHGNMPFKEIAKLTGEPINTVLGHMHYAVKKLKLMLRNENVK
ncbi:MAG: sigma-70 family RNA polymerase sigma factor [Ignavibacteriae bacterium]|nr:sigma-70 family RNA polymerase sigma factor [Ignavibacteriota bacterium]